MKSDRKLFVCYSSCSFNHDDGAAGMRSAFSNVPLLGSSVPNVSIVCKLSRQPTTIIVPDEYPSITDAIGNASAGDTIMVRSGTYFENPIIDKPLTLQGENSANTIVVGTGGYVGASVFTVAADNVKISGFTITSLNYSASAKLRLRRYDRGRQVHNIRQQHSEYVRRESIAPSNPPP